MGIMADEKRSWFKAQWDGWKARALYEFAKFAVGALLLSLFGSATFNQSLTKGAYVAAGLIGVYFMISAFTSKKLPPPEANPKLAAALLKADCEALLQRFKELEFDHREKTRLPLNHASWPNFDAPWSYIHASLYSYNRIYAMLFLKAQIFWIQMEIKEEPKLFSLNENSLMFQVIDALDDLNRRLEAMQAGQVITSVTEKTSK